MVTSFTCNMTLFTGLENSMSFSIVSCIAISYQTFNYLKKKQNVTHRKRSITCSLAHYSNSIRETHALALN